MNLPNKLTVLRVIMVPFFVFFMLVDIIPGFTKWIALALFIIASFTDMFDGKLARKYGLITDFGKFMDPLADKLLVCTAMIALIEMKRIPAWIVIIIIAREFIISGFRLIAAERGTVIAASYWGKFKTTFQMIMIILMIVEPTLVLLGMPILVVNVIMYIALTLTVISLIDYLYKNRGVLK